nr:hypothetical protein [Paenalcaligenes hominis]
MGDYLVSVLQANVGNKLTVELANGLIQAIEKKHHELVATAVNEASQLTGSEEAEKDVA